MKNIIFILLFLIVTTTPIFAQQTKQTIITMPILPFACDCESDLSQAFNGFQKHIIDNNLQKLLDNLVDLYNNIEKTTVELKSQQEELKKSNNIYKEKVVELEHYLYNLEKQKNILSTPEELTTVSPSTK